MDGFNNNPGEGRTGSAHIPGWKISKYRWIIVFALIPFFYLAGIDYLGWKTFAWVYAGIMLYNSAVHFYLSRHYERVGKIPGYIYHIDILAVSSMVYLFGGRETDIYMLYFFIIASYATSNIRTQTMKFSFGISMIYTLSCTIYGMMHQTKWILSNQIVDVLIRDLTILVLTYAITLLIIEVRKADHLHRIEYMKARTDKLTGLPNRHYMEQRLLQEIEDCKISGKVLNVLVFDIDNFKKFNDTYGHVWGDELLKRFSGIITQSIRNTDIPIRYGGEEFIVLIKDIDFATAKGVGDRVRRGLEKEKITIEEGNSQRRVTVSCGIAQYPHHSENIEEVIKQADKALYYAKEGGKNLVVGYDDVLLSEQLNQLEEKGANHESEMAILK